MPEAETVATLAAALQWVRSHFTRQAKIVFPLDGQELADDWIEVRGEFSGRVKGVYHLCDKDGYDYWPHGRVTFNADGKTWTSKFHVHPGKARYTLVVVELDPLALVLVNYYVEHCTKTGYSPIRLPGRLAGFQEHHQVTIHRKR